MIYTIVVIVSVVCGILLSFLCSKIESRKRDESEKEEKGIIIVPKGYSAYDSVPTNRTRSSTSRASQNTSNDPVTTVIPGLGYGGDTSSSSSSSSSDSSSCS